MRRPGSTQGDQCWKALHGGRRHGGPGAAAGGGVERHRERQHRGYKQRPGRLPRPRLPGRTAPAASAPAPGAAVTQLGRCSARARCSRPASRSTSPSRATASSRSAAPTGTIALTRDGAFLLDARGQLVNPNGERARARRYASPRGVDARGRRDRPRRHASTAAGRSIGRIQLVTVPAPNGLAPAGDNNYLVDRRRAAAPAAADGTLAQGALEGSNVDIADAMVDMMDAQRSFSLASRAIQMQDQMMEIANGVKR